MTTTYEMNWVMVHTDGHGVELGQCRVPNDEYGYPLLVAAFRDPEMLELVEGLQEDHQLSLKRDRRNG